MSFRLAAASLPDVGTVDIDIEDDRISAITSTGSTLYTGVQYDLAGHVVLPSFVEAHAHLDKAFLADRINNPTGDLLGAINGLEAVRDTITFDDIVERAVRAAELMSRNGVTSIRTHADTTVEGGLTSVLALLEAKRRCSDFIDIQVAMLLGWPVTGKESASIRALALDAIAAGVDVVGGCPHLDVHSHESVEYFLHLAIDHNLPLDLHADENLRETSDDLEFLADIMLRDNITHQVSASHCVSLSVHAEADISRVAEKVSRAGITVTALPHTNLFLQGRDMTSSIPRAITPVHLLRQSGVVVAAGADNVQDPFNPMGRADPLETASLMVLAAHQSPTDAVSMVTSAASKVVHNHESKIAVGEVANLVAIPATNVREAIAMGPPNRFVVYGGVAISHQKRNIK
jgi:cytosine/creatinine deaminase